LGHADNARHYTVKFLTEPHDKPQTTPFVIGRTRTELMAEHNETVHIPLSLIEQVSRAYAEKFHIDRTDNYFMLKLQEEMGELTQAFMMLHQMGRKKGCSAEERQCAFSDEIADVLCHLLLLAHHHGVDIEQAVKAKWLCL